MFYIKTGHFLALFSEEHAICNPSWLQIQSARIIDKQYRIWLGLHVILQSGLDEFKGSIQIIHCPQLIFPAMINSDNLS